VLDSPCFLESYMNMIRPVTSPFTIANGHPLILSMRLLAVPSSTRSFTLEWMLFLIVRVQDCLSSSDRFSKPFASFVTWDSEFDSGIETEDKQVPRGKVRTNYLVARLLVYTRSSMLQIKIKSIIASLA
jgi:hypothetical protein